jgi:hypothetical protein
VANSISEPGQHLEEWDASSILKADLGAGGMKVLSILLRSLLKQVDLPSGWFPVSIQEHILGYEAGVGANV